MTLSSETVELLRCPACRAQLDCASGTWHCSNDACGRVFPSVAGIPIFIDEDASIFTIETFLQQRPTFFKHENPLVRAVRRRLPTVDANYRSEATYRQFASLFRDLATPPRILVLGGSILGKGMAPLLDLEAELVETDVALGPRTALICDAHQIPFADGSFDGVIAQAVLEHLVDPQRCVAEIHRVLRDTGYVYAETPFMQQVHGGRYDFTRFTHLGHRRLFRHFEEVASGAVCGPGMALAWSIQYFLLSFTTSRLLRRGIRTLVRLTASPWKYFDRYLLDKPGALDAASGLYFLGRKSRKVLADRELLALYRGAYEG